MPDRVIEQPMQNQTGNDPLVDSYPFELRRLGEELEKILIKEEQSGRLTRSAIKQIFHRLHLVKGYSAKMQYIGITNLAQSMEDIFGYLCEDRLNAMDYTVLIDLILAGIDFIKIEIELNRSSRTRMGSAELLISYCRDYLASLRKTSDLAIPQ